jgi:peptidoglycan/LPS O-acetylase OafA/YrhL
LTDTALTPFIGYGDIQQLPARLDQFLAGICAAWICAGRPLSRRSAAACLWGGILAIATLVWVAAARGDFIANTDVPYLFVHHSLTAVSFGLLVLGAAGSARIGSLLFANRGMTFLGVVSYSLYLWHYPLLELARWLGLTGNPRLPPWMAVLGIVVPAILLAAWLSYRYVERPFLRAAQTAPRLPGTQLP